MTQFLEQQDASRGAASGDGQSGRRTRKGGPGLWFLVVMAGLLPPALYALSGIHLDNDIRNWLPEDDPNAVRLAWYEASFPHDESVLVTWEGSTLNDPRVAWLADRLSGVPDAEGVRHGGQPEIARVVTPQELLRRIEDDVVDRTESLSRLQGTLVGTGPMNLQLTELGQARRDSTLKELQTQVRDRLGIELEVLGPVTDWQPANLDNLILPEPIVQDAEVLEPFAPLPEHHARIRWQGMVPRSEVSEQIVALATGLRSGGPGPSEPLVERAFFAPGSPITLAVVLSEAGEAEVRDTIQMIRRVATEVGIPETSLHMGGRPVAGAALNQSVKDAAWNRAASIANLPGRSIVLFSGVVGVVLAFLMLRSLILAPLVLFVSYYTVALSLALVPITGGSMNMVLVVMPTLLLVLTMSGAIHIASYWRFAAKSNLAQAPTLAIQLARRPCFLATLTTAFGLLSLAASPLRPVADFGIYAAVGSFIGLAVILYGLPAMLRYVPDTTAKAPTSLSGHWPAVGRQLVRHRVLVTTACLLAFAVCSLGLIHFDTETRVIKFFPDESQVVRDYNYLEQNIGGIIPIDVVVRFAEDARSPAENGLMFAERQEMVRRIQLKLVDQHPDISGTISLATFRATESVEGMDARRTNPLLRRIDSQAEQTVHESAAARNFVRMADTEARLPDGQLLNEAGDEMWRITAQVNIMSDVDYGDLMADIDHMVREETRVVAGASHVVTGMVPVFLETQQAVLSSLIESFLIAFVVIGAVIAVVLKSARAGLMTMVPNVLPISTVFGAISWCGIRVDIGTMITASVALGIAVDGTLHLLTWFREGIRQGRTRRLAISQALEHCAPALCQTSIVVGTGLLVLMPAELSLISRFGWLMAAMIGTALFADIVLLPALLAGWLGRSIMENELRQMEAESAIPFAQRPAKKPASRSAKPSTPDAAAAQTSVATADTATADDAPRGTPPTPHAFGKDSSRPQSQSRPREDGMLS